MAEWTYDHDNGGTKCVPHTETNLKWTQTADGAATAVGDGTPASFYTLVGAVTESPAVFRGNLTVQGVWKGTFQLTEGAPQVASSCHAGPAPTPPPPLPVGGVNASVWPMPRSIVRGHGTLQVNPHHVAFSVSGNTSAMPELDAAFARTRANCFQHAVESTAVSALTSLVVRVLHPMTELAFEVDEQYNLTIPITGSATVDANTVFGVYHALETFTQLLQFDFDAAAYQINAVPILIQDGPRFAWRELMVDTSRHWLPPRVLRSVVDSMLTAKLNVLHLHLVDSQAFPLRLPSAPRLVDGAYSEAEQYDLADLAALQQYAEARGVRVVAEIDTPGLVACGSRADMFNFGPSPLPAVVHMSSLWRHRMDSPSPITGTVQRGVSACQSSAHRQSALSPWMSRTMSRLLRSLRF